MDKSRKLIGNSVVFAIGNLGSKLITFMLVPLYTFYLSTNEYGMIDIVITTTSMLLPIISSSIYDAVLRFTKDKDQSNVKVFSNAFLITVLGSIIALVVTLFLNYLNIFNGQLWYVYFILILQAFQSLFAQFVVAIGEIKKYSINGIIMAIVISGMNILLLVLLEMGMHGFLLSIIIGNLISIIFLILYCKIYKFIRFDRLDYKLTKKMLVYSIPLIPNTLMWWVMNASSRYFILIFVGTSSNGLFAVANKVPSLLSILNNIFFQAWQLSAIEEYNSRDKSRFYSEVFYNFSMVMFISASAILMLLKYCFKFLLSSEFYLAWEFVPFLLLGVVFSSFSGFLGTNYIAAKQTKGAFRTSVIGGVVNTLLNIILVPLVGTIGASISTMISFFLIWIIRFYDTKKFINIKLNIKSFIANLLIIFTQIFILYLNLEITKEFILEVLLFILLIITNRNLFSLIKKIILNKVKSKISD